MSADDYTKQVMSGNLGDSPVGGDRAAGALLSKWVTLPFASSADGVLAASTNAWVAPRAYTLKKVFIVFGAAITANGTNYTVGTIAKYTAAGGTKTTVASRSTAAANVVAFAPEDLTIVAGTDQIPAGGSFSVEFAKTAAGVAQPAGSVVLELEERGV